MPNPPTTPTIYALASGSQRSGIAVVRVSGPDARLVLDLMAAPKATPRIATYRVIRDPDTGAALDRGIVTWFEAPASFTGEDVVELSLHGGRAVIRSVLDALGKLPGFRPAEPGAFTRRAFENGRIDLTEAEGLADLVAAETEAQRRQALAQSAGSLFELYERWRSELLDASALVEAAIDFADEADVAAESTGRAREIVAALHQELAAHLADGRRGEILREGFRLVLAGPPNAGKSSLLNALAERPAAIVSDEPGTTRDVIEVHLDLDGYPVIVTDTAGIREWGSAIEAEGIRRARVAAATADLVVWIVDPIAPSPPDPEFSLSQEWSKLILVVSKADLIGAGRLPSWLPPGTLTISAKTGAGVGALAALLGARAREATAGDSGPPLTNPRHRELVEAAAASTGRFLEGDPDEAELRAEDLREAQATLGRITGRVDVEEVLDRIFSRFCIGK